MWDRFTEKAKCAVFYAQQEAVAWGQAEVTPEHLLLGLLRVEETLALRILDRIGVNPERIRREVEGFLTRDEADPKAERRLSVRANQVIAFACDESRQLNNRYIGTEHLLAGLLREGTETAWWVLTLHGVRLERVRREPMALISDQG